MADIEEPRRPQNAYWIWLSESREALQKEAGDGGVAAVGKLGGQKWKAMADAQKKQYEKKAAVAKGVYEKALEEFKAGGGVVGKRKQDKADAKKARGSKKARQEARRASGMPKRPPSAYTIWYGETRAAISKEAGTTSLPVVGKLAGEKWRAMNDKSKGPYEKRAADLKEAHEKELAEWKEKHKDAAVEEEDGGDDDDDEDEDGEEA